tara:strand:+ start:2348 stop:3181 length:834 start_codon:yes stop_codon:yes gene_type:complete
MNKIIKKTAVIGNPIKHSLSPQIHNYWIKQNQLEVEEYRKIEINLLNSKVEIKKLLENEFSGLNVTIPLKEIAYEICDNLTETSEKLKAVNTITYNNNSISGDNTDPEGFTKSIAEKIKTENIVGKNVLVIGAGGSARSIVYALDKMQAKITIVNRTTAKAINLSNDLDIPLNIEEFDQINSLIHGFDMVVNTTALGMLGNQNLNIDLSKIKSTAHIYDLIYNPFETQLIKDAKIKNISYQNGLGMLINQAAESFKIWHDVYPTINADLFSLLRNSY